MINALTRINQIHTYFIEVIQKKKPLRVEKDSQLFICLEKNSDWLMSFGGNRSKATSSERRRTSGIEALSVCLVSRFILPLPYLIVIPRNLLRN